MQIKSLFALAASGLALLSSARATTITENFTTDPLQNGWQIFGDAGLFQWDPVNHVLDVTWDSSQPNSYFYHPLGTILGTNDDFSLSYDLLLADCAIGVNPAAPESFELATGFMNFSEATYSGFIRGGYSGVPDLAEFNFYQWDDVPPWPATNTVWPTFVDSSTNFYWNGDSSYGVVELPTGVVMRVVMNYTAVDQMCVLTITTNGSVVVPPVVVVLNAPYVTFGDYHLDTFAIESYSDAESGGSLLAHGTIGNITIKVPRAPVTFLQPALLNGAEGVQFSSLEDWNYILQSSRDLQSWVQVGSPVAGTGGKLTLQDTNSPQTQLFYRVLAQRED
jgi:hypothetical protein